MEDLDFSDFCRRGFDLTILSIGIIVGVPVIKCLLCTEKLHFDNACLFIGSFIRICDVFSRVKV